ncbi:MAG: flippase-like domain-containing protein [Labilithrix sp.]|nr:flippase-like domain-containing protein [Labilithrix sp.]
MAESTRSRLVAAAKVIATVTLLALVFRKIPLADVTERLGRLRVGDIAALLVVTTTQVALNVARWWRLLRSVGERVPYRAVFGDLCVGISWSMILPGIGGDVMRALRARRRVRAPHHAWSTSIYERIVGLFAMTTVATIAVALGLSDSVALPSWLRGATFALTLALALVLVFASTPFRVLARVLGRKLPAAASADIAGIADDLAGPLAKTSVRAEAFAWSLAYHATALLFAIISARALGAPGHERAIVVGVPLINVLSLVPVTIGGHGLREGLYVGVLGALGMSGDVALGLSAMFLASALLFSLVGAAVLLVSPAKR